MNMSVYVRLENARAGRLILITRIQDVSSAYEPKYYED